MPNSDQFQEEGLSVLNGPSRFTCIIINPQWHQCSVYPSVSSRGQYECTGLYVLVVWEQVTDILWRECRCISVLNYYLNILEYYNKSSVVLLILHNLSYFWICNWLSKNANRYHYYKYTYMYVIHTVNG